MDPESRLPAVASSPSSDDTEAFGAALGCSLEPGDVVLLAGDLAAGKTTLVRGLVRGLGGDPDEVDSPTFVLLQTYPCTGRDIDRVHHVDLYRLDDEIAALREIGIEEVLSDRGAVTAIEWPKDTLAAWLPSDARVWRVGLTVEDDDVRRIELTGPPTG